MKFVLLGGIGYVGGRLAAHLKSAGHHVIVTSRRSLKKIPKWMIADKFYQSDLLQPKSLKSIFQKCDAVIMLAAPDEIESAQHPIESIRAGSEITWAVCEAILKHNSKARFLNMSTFHVYNKTIDSRITEQTPTKPLHPYSLGRLLSENVVQYFRAKGLLALNVRLSNSFGFPVHASIPRWSLVFNDLSKQAVKTKKLILKSKGDQKRNFIALSDAVKALEYLVLNSDQWPMDGVINLGSELNLSIREVAELVARISLAKFNYEPSIIVNNTSPESGSSSLEFSVDRLIAMGFQWSNPVETEIEKLLDVARLT